MRDPETLCRNLYAFIRLRFGPDVSDREIARRWGMGWKSFTLLKNGQRQVPRINELEELARLLAVDAAFVFEVARGVSAKKVHKLLQENDREHLSQLLMKGVHDARVDAEVEGQRFRAILDRVHDGVFTVDLQGNFKDVNHGLTEITGYASEELLERSLFDLLSSSETPRIMETLASVYSRGDKRSVELEAGSKSGEEVVLELSAARIDDSGGDAVGIQGIIRDITERKRLERERAEQHAKLQVVFDAIPGVCMLDANDGTILLANRVLYAVAKKKKEEVLGRKIWEVFGVEEDPECPVLRAAASGKVEQKIAKIRGEDGREVYFHRTAHPILGSDGQVKQVVEIARDVTDRVCGGDPKLLMLWRTGDLPPDEVGLGDIEKRRFVRVPLEVPVDFGPEGKSGTGQGRNLSRAGMFIETDDVFPVGTTITLTWSWSEGDSIISATGVVAWNTEGSQRRPHGLGVEFTKLEPRHQYAIIERVLKAAHGSGAGVAT